MPGGGVVETSGVAAWVEAAKKKYATNPRTPTPRLGRLRSNARNEGRRDLKGSEKGL